MQHVNGKNTPNKSGRILQARPGPPTASAWHSASPFHKRASVCPFVKSWYKRIDAGGCMPRYICPLIPKKDIIFQSKHSFPPSPLVPQNLSPNFPPRNLSRGGLGIHGSITENPFHGEQAFKFNEKQFLCVKALGQL